MATWECDLLSARMDSVTASCALLLLLLGGALFRTLFPTDAEASLSRLRDYAPSVSGYTSMISINQQTFVAQFIARQRRARE